MSLSRITYFVFKGTLFLCLVNHVYALRVHPLVAFITLDPPLLGVVIVAYLAGLGSVRW